MCPVSRKPLTAHSTQYIAVTAIIVHNSHDISKSLHYARIRGVRDVPENKLTLAGGLRTLVSRHCGGHGNIAIDNQLSSSGGTWTRHGTDNLESARLADVYHGDTLRVCKLHEQVS